MDPITASIVGALMAGVLSGFTEIGKTAITDAYIKLKSLLNKKFGSTSGIMPAIAQLEAKPDSPNRRGVLQEEITRVRAWQDADVLAAAKQLQMVVQQQQSINIQRAQVQGSIYQVGGNQYQVDAAGLVGPRARRSTRRVIGVLLIVGGLVMGIPAGGMLIYFNTFVKTASNFPSGGPEFSGFQDILNSFGLAADILIFTMIGLSILMVIGGIWLSRK